MTRLHELLSTRVAQLIGRTVSVWRDSKLDGNDVFGEELRTRLEKVALLVSVFSPRYFNSEWCCRELRAFLEVAQRSGGMRFGNKLRVFKLLRTPLPRQGIPADFQWLLDETLGYEFYRQLESGRMRDFLLDPDLRREYWLRLDDLAQDIAEALRALTQNPDGVSESGGEKETVYLAETTSDMQGARDSIRRELALRGYRVVPEGPLPLRASDLQQAVQTWIETAKLSVHPIGSVYGLIPESAQESLVALQLQAVASPSSTDHAEHGMTPNALADPGYAWASSSGILKMLTGQQLKGVLWRRTRRPNCTTWNSSTRLPQGKGALGCFCKPGPTKLRTRS